MIHQQTTIQKNDVVFIPGTRTLAIVVGFESGLAVIEWMNSDSGEYKKASRQRLRVNPDHLIVKWTAAEIDRDKNEGRSGATSGDAALIESNRKKRYYEANREKIQAKYREWYRNLPEDRKEAIRASRRMACLKCRAKVLEKTN